MSDGHMLFLSHKLFDRNRLSSVHAQCFGYTLRSLQFSDQHRSDLSDTCGSRVVVPGGTAAVACTQDTVRHTAACCACDDVDLSDARVAAPGGRAAVAGGRDTPNFNC